MRLYLLLIVILSCASKHPFADFSSDEEELTQNIHTIFHSRFKEIRKDRLDQAQKNISKFSHFKPYKVWLDDIAHIYQYNTVHEKIYYCHQDILKKSDKYPYSYLYKNLVLKCQRMVDENIDDIKGSISESAVLVLLDNMNYFLGIDENQILPLLKEVKSPDTKNRINYLLTQHFNLIEQTPPRYLKNYITINSNLSKLVSKHGYDFKEKRAKFYRDISKDIRVMYNYGATPQIHKSVKKRFGRVKNKIRKNAYFLDNSAHREEFISFALFLNRNQKTDRSRQILDLLTSEYTLNKGQKNKVWFNYIWSYVIDGNYNAALSYIEKNKLIENFHKLYSQPQFWIARVIELKGNKKTADSLKAKLVKHNPISFYASIVMKDFQIEDSPYFKELSSFYKNEKDLNDLSEKFKQYDIALERIKAFTASNARSLIHLELKEVKNHFFKHEEDKETRSSFHYYISQQLHKYGAYLTSFRVLFNAMEENEVQLSYGLLKNIFPKPFEGEIDKNKENLNEIFLYSLIRQESGFNPRAKSPVGALGLMQLMPGTAKRYEKKITKNSLKTPDKNLEIGVKYLKDLFKRYDNNLVDILSAYNAGERRIDKWRRTYLTKSERLNNIESIPFNETRKYVKLILRNMFFYNFVHFNRAPAEIERGPEQAKNI